MEFLNELVALFATLAGFAAFIALVVNILKKFGIVSDDSAGLWAKVLNLVGLVVVGVLYLVVPDAIPAVDKILGLLAELGGVLLPILALVLGWPVMNRVSKFAHDNVRGVPLLGYSNSKG